MSRKYNGWANYETWCVAMWLTNEVQSYRFWREAAQQAIDDARSAITDEQGGESVAETAIDCLATQLSEFADRAEGLKIFGFWGDLLTMALNDVQWPEIAHDFLEDYLLPLKNNPVVILAPTAEFRFPLGRIVVTPAALTEVGQDDIATALNRHVRGDWGVICEEDAGENEAAIEKGFRLLSIYETRSGKRFWIITEADRSVTTILLPGEY